MRPIDADATKEKLSFAIEPFIGSAADEIRNDTLLKAIAIVDSMPTVDAQPVNGKWIIYNLYARCSECSASYDFDTFQRLIPMDEKFPRHCSYCGAYMRGD